MAPPLAVEAVAPVVASLMRTHGSDKSLGKRTIRIYAEMGDVCLSGRGEQILLPSLSLLFRPLCCSRNPLHSLVLSLVPLLLFVLPALRSLLLFLTFLIYTPSSLSLPLLPSPSLIQLLLLLLILIILLLLLDLLLLSYSSFSSSSPLTPPLSLPLLLLIHSPSLSTSNPFTLLIFFLFLFLFHFSSPPLPLPSLPLRPPLFFHHSFLNSCPVDFILMHIFALFCILFPILPSSSSRTSASSSFLLSLYCPLDFYHSPILIPLFFPILYLHSLFSIASCPPLRHPSHPLFLPPISNTSPSVFSLRCLSLIHFTQLLPLSALLQILLRPHRPERLYPDVLLHVRRLHPP